MTDPAHAPRPTRAGTILARAPSWLAAIVLFALVWMTFFDVILRSAFNNPIESATELTRIFMAIIVFSSLPVITWRGGHIAVDLLDPLFSERLARLRDSAIDIVCGLVLVWPALRVWQLAQRAQNYGTTTEYLEIPVFYIAYFIAVCTILTAIVFVVRGIARLVAPSYLTARSDTQPNTGG